MLQFDSSGSLCAVVRLFCLNVAFVANVFFRSCRLAKSQSVSFLRHLWYILVVKAAGREARP